MDRKIIETVDGDNFHLSDLGKDALAKSIMKAVLKLPKARKSEKFAKYQTLAFMCTYNTNPQQTSTGETQDFGGIPVLSALIDDEMFGNVYKMVLKDAAEIRASKTKEEIEKDLQVFK